VKPGFIVAHPGVINGVLCFQIISTICYIWVVGVVAEALYEGEGPEFIYGIPDLLGLEFQMLYMRVYYSIPYIIMEIIGLMICVFTMKYCERGAVFTGKALAYILLIKVLTTFL
jgi:hypothetical protein